MIFTEIAYFQKLRLNRTSQS
jgi:hypothetical protein